MVGEFFLTFEPDVGGSEYVQCRCASLWDGDVSRFCSGVRVVELACDVGMSVGGGAAGNRDNAVVSDGRDVNAGGGVAR